MKKCEESKMKPRLWPDRVKRFLPRDGANRNSAGRGGFGWKDKEFGLGHVEFQTDMGHPNRKVRQTVRGALQNVKKEFWNGEIKLGDHWCRDDIVSQWDLMRSPRGKIERATSSDLQTEP